MKIVKVKIKNFRLLKDIEVELNEDTTVFVGKNNAGKTSFSEIFNIFFKKNIFDINDFNIQARKELYEKIKEIPIDLNDENNIKKLIEVIPKIQMFITFNYLDGDDWGNILPFLTSLEEENEITVLLEYSSKDSIKFLEEISKIDFLPENDFNEKLKEIIKVNYRVIKKTFSETSNFHEEIEQSKILKLFNWYFINAQRNLDDGISNTSNKLSKIMSAHYESLKTDSSEDITIELENGIKETNNLINGKIENVFKDFYSSFSSFGFPGLGGEQIKLKSELETKELFSGSVGVYYQNKDCLLPEKYNGLGYSNLIYIISKILSFQKINEKENKDKLNLIFIEEPEAHMHPQMQKIFIKKINSFFREKKFNIQIIITTHSSEILSNTDFENIRYFLKKENQSQIKDLLKFKNESNKEKIKYLTKYMTLENSQMFFADKIIMLEGVVERVLMPIFFNKIKFGNEQYIAIVEIGGAYMHIFKELLEFLEIKTLIITDIDSARLNESNHWCGSEIENDDKLETTNPVLKQWIPKEKNIIKLLEKNQKSKINNNVMVAYQTNQATNGEIKCGRTFEEAFLITNLEYIIENKEYLKSINNSIKDYNDREEIWNNSFTILKYIEKNKKKNDFAFDLFFESDSWQIPPYIEEGLRWLLKK